MSQCRHYRTEDGSPVCGIGQYVSPVELVCFTCPAYEGPSRGLGDTLAKSIKAITLGLVKPCGGCKDRAATLNAAVPYDSTRKDERLGVTE